MMLVSENELGRIPSSELVDLAIEIILEGMVPAPLCVSGRIRL